MADESHVIRGIDWKATFPFTLIFRSFRVAIHPSKIVLAMLTLLLAYIGGRVLDGIWPASSRAVPGEVEVYSMSRFGADPTGSFERWRDRQIKASRDHFNARLASINKADGDLGDLEADIKDRRAKAVDAARVRHDASIDAADKAYDSSASKDDAAARRRDDARASADGARDATIASAYDLAREQLDADQNVRNVGLSATFYEFEVSQVNRLVRGVRYGNWLGQEGVVVGATNFFGVGPVWAFRYHPLYFSIYGLFFLTIWSLFGGAISRIAAVQVARDEKISIRQALRFSSAKFLSFLSAPIIPLIIVLIVALVVALGGLLGNIPFIGPILVGALFFLAIIAGFVMTLVLLGLAGGANLMYPTIAVEGSDSFDAISRSFSYLYARPWRLGFYTVVALVYGALCYTFVRLFLVLLLNLTHASAGAFIFTDAPDGAPLWSSLWSSPMTTGRLAYDIDFFSLSAGQSIGAFLLGCWVYLVIALLGAFAISFYFSANTIIYYLMRNEVDATELDDVFLEQSEDDFINDIPPTEPAVADGPAPMTTGESPVPDMPVPAPQAAEPVVPPPPAEGGI